MERCIPQKPEKPKSRNKVVTHALFIQRLAQIQRNAMKELTSDFVLFYSLLVVYHRAQNCFELEQLSLLN